MKKTITALICLTCIMTLTGCSGVSQEEYDAVCAERDLLQAKLTELQAETDDNSTDYLTVDISGHFSATVRDVIPDYCLDGSTPQVAVVTLFQDAPFTLFIGETADQLEIGKNYVFEIKPQESVKMTADEYQQGCSDVDTAISLYNIQISSFRLAEEDEWGLDTDHLVYELHQ